MRILLLTHAFNSLTQRLGAELQRRGHEISIEFDIADSVAEEAVALFKPDLIVAPYLRRAIPESIWSQYTCLIVHPGIIGDRGPSALDWAIQQGEAEWGVTVLQAEAEMDAGPIWASAAFPLRHAKKSSIYRNEVTQAATGAVLQALERFIAGNFVPTPLAACGEARGRLRPLMKQTERVIDWHRDDTATVLRKMNAADGFPGVADTLFGEPCHIFDAWPEAILHGELGSKPGEALARREGALLRRTRDGALWIGHAKRAGDLKLPATLAFAPESAALAEAPLQGWWRAGSETWQDIAYEESGSDENAVGFLHFEFYNGAMSTAQCVRLQSALAWAKQRPVKVLVLMGGADFWSNGIHLNVIEAADSPADESWNNINAMNDVARELIEAGDQITVAALAGNAGAGGCFLARAADHVWAREGVMLNPHYKNMGNLYGSEYWTYLLPRRVSEEGARGIMRNRQPLTAQSAAEIGFTDACLAGDPQAFRIDVARRAAEIVAAPELAAQLSAKRERRARDEAEKPLTAYREEELAHMRRNFYGFDPSYHVARHHFVRKSLASWTPRHLARHRDLGWKVPT